MAWKVIGKHKWVAGAVITESHNERKSTTKKAYNRFTATIRGWRNWKICEGFYDECTTQSIIEKVQDIQDRIDEGDESVFKEPM